MWRSRTRIVAVSKGNDTSDTLQTLCSPRLKREANDVGRKEEAVGSRVEEVREEGKGKREKGRGRRMDSCW